jgi:hypothetical protein
LLLRGPCTPISALKKNALFRQLWSLCFFVCWRFIRVIRCFFSQFFCRAPDRLGRNIINLPMSKAAGYTSAGLRKALYMTVGCISLALVLHALFFRKLLKLAHIEIYLVVYMIGVFNSPSFDSRFWRPILPFVLFIVLQSKIPAYVLNPYKALYIASGLFALGYYSLLSFNKEVFASRHDAGIWKAEYETLFSGNSGNQFKADSPALYLLKRYN